MSKKLTKTTICKDCGTDYLENGKDRCPKCIKARKQYIRENLEQIEKVLNDHEEWELDNGCFIYELYLHKNDIEVDISIEDEEHWGYTVNVEEMEDVSVRGICKAIINNIYEEDINPKQAFIKETCNYNNRKIKSLSLWTSRENTKKIEEITKELVERFNDHHKAKSKLEEYKSYVCHFYNVLWELCPQWKTEDICTYVKERLEKFNITGVDVTTGENKLIVTKNDFWFEVEIDSFSKKENVFNLVRVKLDLIENKLRKGGM